MTSEFREEIYDQIPLDSQLKEVCGVNRFQPGQSGQAAKSQYQGRFWTPVTACMWIAAQQKLIKAGHNAHLKLSRVCSYGYFLTEISDQLRLIKVTLVNRHVTLGLEDFDEGLVCVADNTWFVPVQRT